MYKNTEEELPSNTFECVVKIWNQFNDSYETGVGIYDIPTSKWEVRSTESGLNSPVHFWIKTPELEVIL